MIDIILVVFNDLTSKTVKNYKFNTHFHDFVDKNVKKDYHWAMTKVSNVYSKIRVLRERYYRVSIGKQDFLALLNETEVAEQVYNSNAIENSTLSLDETEKILLQIDLDRYISEREIFEAKNLARVVSYIDQKAKDRELTLDGILLLHKMLLSTGLFFKKRAMNMASFLRAKYTITNLTLLRWYSGSFTMNQNSLNSVCAK